MILEGHSTPSGPTSSRRSLRRQRGQRPCRIAAEALAASLFEGEPESPYSARRNAGGCPARDPGARRAVEDTRILFPPPTPSSKDAARELHCIHRNSTGGEESVGESCVIGTDDLHETMRITDPLFPAHSQLLRPERRFRRTPALELRRHAEPDQMDPRPRRFI